MKIMEKLANYKRVLKIASKPSKEEFLTAARICAIGMVVLGAIGFIFYLISVYTGL